MRDIFIYLFVGLLLQTPALAAEVEKPKPRRLTDYLRQTMLDAPQEKGPADLRAPRALPIGEIGQRPHGETQTLDVPGFIVKEPFVVVGAVVGMGKNRNSAAEGDRVVVEQENSGSLIPGRIYTVVRTASSVENPTDRKYVGTKYIHVGSVQIKGTTPDQGKMLGLIAKAHVFFGPGDLLVPFLATKRISSLPAVHKIRMTTPLTIIDVGIESQSWAGEGVYVYLTKSADLVPGAYLGIYQQREEASNVPAIQVDVLSDPKAKHHLEKVGSLEVVHITDVAACGVIRSATRPIHVGSVVF